MCIRDSNVAYTCIKVHHVVAAGKEIHPMVVVTKSLSNHGLQFQKDIQVLKCVMTPTIQVDEESRFSLPANGDAILQAKLQIDNLAAILCQQSL